ncbi:hypothetical protein LUZ60_013659 [Juncus effusus]|nr:hypothetical protein LUZ60_013659 [Juncus effusus]
MENNNKRSRDESNLHIESDDQPKSNRIRRLQFNNDSNDQPDFDLMSLLRAMIAETIRGIHSPIIRSMKHQEVQKVLIDTLPMYGNPQCYIENPQLAQQEPRLQLIFANQISQQIFTANAITDDLKNPIQIQIIDIEMRAICTNEVEVRIVVIDGRDLEELEVCDDEKFNSSIVQPRDGKASLLSNETEITLKQGVGNLEGISFTDNSEWIRSGKFRLVVYAETGTDTNGISINGALSKKFVVRDHLSELNKKHYPPILCLQDEAWRLKKIAKDGKYHTRLKENGIDNVQDFLRKWYANSNELQNDILQMPQNSWDKLIKHARKCPMGEDSYLFRTGRIVIRLNPIGEILEASYNGEIGNSYNDLHPQLKVKYASSTEIIAFQFKKIRPNN